MRHHFGLGVGHTYSHIPSNLYGNRAAKDSSDQRAHSSDLELSEVEEHDVADEIVDVPLSDCDEPGQSDSEDKGSVDDSDQSSGSNIDEGSERSASDDEELLAHDEMYGVE